MPSTPTPVHKRGAPDHPILELFAERWSPYAFSPEPVTPEDLQGVFEAARWAASSYNEQPWEFVVAPRDDEAGFARLLSLLVEPNQAWARDAPVLALGLVRRAFSRNGTPNKAAEHDLGLATANLMLEATRRGLAVHAMIGILPERAREVLALPDGVEAFTGLAIGHPGPASALPDGLRARDEAPRVRKPLEAFVFQGRYGEPAWSA